MHVCTKTTGLKSEICPHFLLIHLNMLIFSCFVATGCTFAILTQRKLKVSAQCAAEREIQNATTQAEILNSQGLETIETKLCNRGLQHSEVVEYRFILLCWKLFWNFAHSRSGCCQWDTGVQLRIGARGLCLSRWRKLTSFVPGNYKHYRIWIRFQDWGCKQL